MRELNIGDEVEFHYCGKMYSGVIADYDDYQVFIRIPSSQIFIINKEDVIE